MIKLIGILVLISALIVVLTYNGVFKDKDKDGIPDAVEDKAAEIKRKVKKKISKKQKCKNQKFVNVETAQTLMDSVTALI